MQYPIPSVLYEIYCEFRELPSGKLVGTTQAILVQSENATTDDYDDLNSASTTIVCPSIPW